MKEVAQYKYGDVIVGRLFKPDFDRGQEREFVPELNDLELEELVRGMDVGERIHMYTEAYGVYKALRFYDLDPSLYVDDSELVPYVVGLGCRNLSELNRKDRKAWELVRERSLASILFPLSDAPVLARGEEI